MSDQPRNWMTAEEFLAQVEAHRLAAAKRRQEVRKPFVMGLPDRIYVLNRNRKYEPKPKLIVPEEEAP